MGKIVLVFVVLLVVSVCGQEDVFQQAFPNADMDAFRRYLPYLLKDQQNVSLPTPTFAACPSISVPPDTNDVTNLRPGNIRVVMAMGDSITAGMSAKDTNVLSLKEYRGLAYAIGGDPGLTTFPNLLAPFVPTGYPKGFSTGIGSRTSSGNGLNAAVSGAINSDMPGQAQWLVQQLQANPNIDINNDWKVLTLWIGSNNLCDVCDDQPNNNGDNFQAQVNASLQYLFANVPKLFINLVSNLEISQLHNINSGACSLLHMIACGCVGSSNANTRALVASTGRDYQARAYTLAKYFNALASGKSRTDFAVVVQPFLLNTTITDRSQLSAADCFHPSAASHATAAVALWNNIISPAAQKKTAWNPSDVPLCPDVNTLLYTY